MKKQEFQIEPITLERVTAMMVSHSPVYRWHQPVYQLTLLQDLARIWLSPHERLLDVGGGTGLLAEAVQLLLPVGRVTSVDVKDRYLNTLTVETGVYDGRTLPFADLSFDAATISNVIHHVPPALRSRFMSEVCRVVAGPIYVKDHIASTPLDKLRLVALDMIGNLPFSGQVSATYLTRPDWDQLAVDCDRVVADLCCGRYRHGVMALLFPNRVEAVFRLDTIADANLRA